MRRFSAIAPPNKARSVYKSITAQWAAAAALERERGAFVGNEEKQEKQKL